jgi:4-diphosphocytidyl-2-C-methyl-D-erythritol kinase
MRLLCPAKVNLHLRVGRRRADGFHPLLTWMTTVGLFDTLTVETNPPGRERAGAERILLLSSDQPGLPADGTNLVVRAAEAFAEAIAGRLGATGDVGRAISGRSFGTGQAVGESGSDAIPRTADRPARRPGGPQPLAEGEGLVSPGSGRDGAVPTPGVGEGVGAAGTAGQRQTRIGGEADHVRPVSAVLEKQIPLGAGLGGGSSDAARTLIGLNDLWEVRWPVERLSEIAGRLGSDVPFFLYGPSSVCTGRGEVVRPVAKPRAARWVVLILPDVHMPTPAVYRRFDELKLGFDDQIAHEPDWNNWATLSSKELLPCLVNDLERPAFELKPALDELRAGIELQLGRAVRMSGSGSSLFTLYDDGDDANAAASGISENFAVRATAVELAPDDAKNLNGNAPPA